MKKIFLFVILLSIISTYIFENNSERFLKKTISYALNNEDVIFETDIKDAKYFCSFVSIYSIKDIKPDLKSINAKYNPWIGFRIYTLRKHGATAAVAVKENNSLFITYLSWDNFEFTEPVNLNKSRCIPTNSLHYKIKNKTLYVTP